MSRRILACLAGAASIAVLTACAGPAADPSPRRSDPSSSSSPSRPTRTPSASASPTPDPAVPATWIISQDGVGPLRIGDPVEEAVAIVKPSVAPVTSACGNPTVTFLGPAGATSADAPFLLSATSDTARIVAVAVSGRQPRTPGGVGVGSTEAAVRSEYPDATDSTRAGAEIRELVVRGDPGWLTFQLSQDATVDLVSVVDGGEPPSEFCG